MVSPDTKEMNNLQGSVIINAQYIKDLSFENPRAPYSLMENEKPNINIDLDVKADHIHDETFEVIISVSIKAITDNTTFVIDLSYAGLFTLTDVSEQSTREMILLVHCANILFPYVRRVISDITRDGGFPPLMLAPVDFMGLYYAKRNETYNQQN
jgi:preprotein translocase subunit SecB